MADMTPEQIVEVLVPVIEGAIARRMEEVYGTLEVLREEFQQTINVMDGNDHAIIAAVQELRGVVTGEGYIVEEVVKRAAESWERFVRSEAEKLGLKMLVPKVPVEKVPVETIEVRDAQAEEEWDR